MADSQQTIHEGAATAAAQGGELMPPVEGGPGPPLERAVRREPILRPLQADDRGAHATLLYRAFNTWYWAHGWGKDYFSCAPEDTAIFYDMYDDLTPGRSIAAFHPDTGALMGACFFHPREHHVSLGIMAVDPDYGGQGVGRRLVSHILDFTRAQPHRSCRLVSSAINMDSFSLYNRAGFIPRVTYQDMVVPVPVGGLPGPRVPGSGRVRPATLADATAMGDREMAVSGIRRELDYHYAIRNPRGVLEALVYQSDEGGVDGFVISVKHPALNMLGPLVARDEAVALALIGRGLERFRGEGVLAAVPMTARTLVEQFYGWKAINVETHLMEAWGPFPGFHGVSMPSFLPETG